MAVDIHDLRKRILAGEAYSREELREAIASLRGERVAVATNTTAKRQVTKGMSDDELDDDFMSIVAQVQGEKK